MDHDHDEPYISPRQEADEAAREEAERAEMRRLALEAAAETLARLKALADQYRFDAQEWVETVMDEMTGKSAHDLAHGLAMKKMQADVSELNRFFGGVRK